MLPVVYLTKAGTSVQSISFFEIKSDSMLELGWNFFRFRMLIVLNFLGPRRRILRIASKAPLPITPSGLALFRIFLSCALPFRFLISMGGSRRGTAPVLSIAYISTTNSVLGRASTSVTRPSLKPLFDR